MTSAAGLRVGMVGTGAMAEAIVGDVALAGMRLTAVAGRDPDRTRAFAERHGIERALRVGDLWAEDLDLVYVATTHDSHLALARDALRAGHPVLVEKAFTTTAEEAEELVALSEQTGLFLMEAMWMRFTPAVRTLQELIADGALGEPRNLIASFGFSLPPGPHRLRERSRGGGSLLDQGVYPLALADIVFGHAESVAVVGTCTDADGQELDVDTELGMLLGYRGGRHALLATSIRADLPFSATIGGREARIELGGAFWGSERLTVHRSNGRDSVFDLPHEGRGYVPMLRAVGEALDAGWREHPLADHASTLRVMRMVDTVASELRRS